MDVQNAPYQAPANGFRTFVILWATQALSVFGSQLTFFAMTVWLTTRLYPAPEQQGLLAAALSAIALAFALPNVLMAPVAGALADRVDRKAIMLWTNLGSGLVSLALMAVLMADMLSVPVLVAMMAVFAILMCIHNSAFEASYAMIVPEQHLPRANGMMQTVFGLSGILSPAVAAALIALPGLLRGVANPGWLVAAVAGLTDGAALAIAVDAVSFVIAAAVLPFLTVPSPQRNAVAGAPRRSMIADVKEGISFISARRGLLWLLLTFAVVNFCGAPFAVLRPILVRDNLAADYLGRGLSYEAALALIGSVGAVGGVIGGVLITAWGGLKRRRIYGVLLPLVLGGLTQAVFGLANGFYVALGAMAVNMFVFPMANAHSQTIWQVQTPREMQGRVFAVRRVVAQFTYPLGTATAAFLGGWLGPGLAIAACGIISASYALLQLANRTVISVEDTPPKAVAAGAKSTARAVATGA